MKQLKQEEVYRCKFDNVGYDIRAKDLPPLLPDDIIDIQREEEFQEDYWYSETNLVIYREREETDEEYQKRMEEEKEFKEHLRKRRYENYLKLKKEFEA